MIGSDKRVGTLDPDGTPAVPNPSVDNPQHETREGIPIPKELIILFVRDLDRAQQYLDLRDDIRVRRPYVRPCATPTQATAALVALENERLQKFELLDMPHILAAVHDYFLELHAQRQLRFSVRNQGSAIDKYPLSEPVGYLLFLARQEGYVLDMSPVAEFDKLRKFSPLYYKDHFIRLQAHVAVEEARTVTVSNLADHVSETEIMTNFFSTCGVIKTIEMQSESHGPVANVTFKHSFGANKALTYKGSKIPGLSKPSVVDGETKYEPLLVKPKAVKDARSDREKAEDVERMYAEALERYSAIVGRYPRDESKDCEDLKYWEDCGWMVVEAMANGGYTVIGQRLPEDPPPFGDTFVSF